MGKASANDLPVGFFIQLFFIHCSLIFIYVPKVFLSSFSTLKALGSSRFRSLSPAVSFRFIGCGRIGSE